VARISTSRADRVTTGLAVAAIATAGTVIVSEIARNVRRRLRAETDGHPTQATMGQAATAAGRGAQDTLAVAFEGFAATPHSERVLINLLTGFTGAFALMRLSAFGIRSGWWPFGNTRVAGRHIHHFIPGILTAFGAGTAALVSDSPSLERALAVPFGAGLGMTFDEAALLLELRDVYWTREGLLSVQMSLGILAILGAAVISLRIIGRGEQRAISSGVIPVPYGEGWALSPITPGPH
jgi:hypothetical protein